MNCMKCGRELNEEGVFCAECLAEMENYPVKPDVVVQLPRRTMVSASKKPSSRRRTHLSLEEQVKTLRKLVLRLILALLISLLLLAATGYFAVIHLLENDGVLLPGQNYSAMDSTMPTEEA